MVEDWFKVKKYPHIGLPITIKDYGKVKHYVNNKSKISKHSFLPFIHKKIVKRKYRANKISPQRNPSGKRKRIKNKPKIRDIFFASHLDAMIFSKYNSILSDKYEEFLKNKGFNKAVVAYRKIPVTKGKKGNKCNIDFARESFQFIIENQEDNLSVIVADVSSFFDNLNHKHLKSEWSKVLDRRTLPKDHYNIFKALTRIKYVESEQLYNSYNKTMIVERGIPNDDKKTRLIRKRVKDSKYFKEKGAVAYCKKNEFIKNNLNLIISKNNETGIPQGSPISATLANIYMLSFDEKIYKEIDKMSGFYQRYSDDLIIICRRKFENQVLNLIRKTISDERINLQIHPDKTKVYHFEKKKNILEGYQINEITKKRCSNKKLEYLGFSFDGQRVLIKSSGFSKFYRNMKGAFNRATTFAISKKNPHQTIFKSKLYKRFTHKGAKRKAIYHPDPKAPQKYIKTEKYNWGNYLSYIYKANETMKSINNNDSIKRQGRKIWSNFHKLMEYHQKKINRELKKQKTQNS